jgi:hypothetical protein
VLIDYKASVHDVVRGLYWLYVSTNYKKRTAIAEANLKVLERKVMEGHLKVVVSYAMKLTPQSATDNFVTIWPVFVSQAISHLLEQKIFLGRSSQNDLQVIKFVYSKV